MIITLCGSAKFESSFRRWNRELGLRGHPVFSLTSYPAENGGNKDWYTAAQKVTLDLVHLKKIEASQAIMVLNVGGYVGESTSREIEWARMLDKKVIWLEETELRLMSCNESVAEHAFR